MLADRVRMGAGGGDKEFIFFDGSLYGQNENPGDDPGNLMTFHQTTGNGPAFYWHTAQGQWSIRNVMSAYTSRQHMRVVWKNNKYRFDYAKYDKLCLDCAGLGGNALSFGTSCGFAYNDFSNNTSTGYYLNDPNYLPSQIEPYRIIKQRGYERQVFTLDLTGMPVAINDGINRGFISSIDDLFLELTHYIQSSPGETQSLYVYKVWLE